MKKLALAHEEIDRIPPCLTTREAMKLCRVRSYEGLKSILEKHGIRPAWRGGEGNVYRGSDFRPLFYPDIDNAGDPFYDVVDG